MNLAKYWKGNFASIGRTTNHSKNKELISDEMQSWSSCKSPLWSVSGYIFGAGYSSVFSLITSTISCVAAWGFLMNHENYVIYFFSSIPSNSKPDNCYGQYCILYLLHYLPGMILNFQIPATSSSALFPNTLSCILEMESVIQILST